MQVDGPSVLRKLRLIGCPTRVVFLSAYTDSALVYSALEAGAAGFLSKRADRAVICDALGQEIRSHRRDDRPALTEREQEVLALAAEGLSAARIGERLFLSPATVKTHLAHLYEKLGVSDRAAAVAAAFRHRILE